MVKSMFSTMGLPKEREPVIVDWKRSALGKKRGGLLRRLRGDDMIVPLLRYIVDENLEGVNFKKLADEGKVDCLVGCNSQVGAMALDIARTTALAAHLPISVPGVSMNRQCASGMTTVWFGWHEILTGDKDIALCGGVEAQTTLPIMADMTIVGPGNKPQTIPPNIKISKHPYILEKSEEYGQRMSAQIPGAELMGKVWNNKIGNLYEEFRLELDELSVNSHMKAKTDHAYEMRGKEILPIKVPKLDEKGEPITDPKGQLIEGETDIADVDEGVRPNTTVEKCQKLRGIVKRRKGYLTAGNSCPETDGAAIMMLTSRGFAEEHGLKIRGTIEMMANVGTDPIMMLTGPIEATPIVMKKAETSLDEMEFIEINEAFSTVVKASCYELGLDWKDPRFNVWGGAIAIGHPTGMTGTRLIGTTLHQLEETQKTYAYSTLCVGLGMGMGCIVKREGA
ncbi:MAG: acetyl-CoA C-acyltransferase [Candidatus Lokiarchaeota archaeon]|nr:acetyl-CoA C-acyltransferase [Candidatus Lokiarchaeota archaeon]